MNATTRPESTALAVPQQFDLAATDAASLILGPAFDRVQAFAGLMCKGAVTVPQHLRGNPGDCMAVTLAALSRRMDPFAFAQKTHVTKSGALGYESQLIKSMITTSGKVEGQPEYEFLGDWSQILGKVEERTSEKNGGKYYVAAYKKADENGLGVIIRWRLRGERAPREMTVMMSQCYPRFSTQWATDPQQQICYVADRKFARRFCPETILGIYDTDELEPNAGEPKFMGPADVVQPSGSPATATAAAKEQVPEAWPDDKLQQRFPKYLEWLAAGKTHEEIIAFAQTKGTLTEAQKAKIRALKPAAGAASAEAKPADATADQATDVTPKVTFAQVAERINGAQDRAQLADAADLIGEVADEKQRAELTAIHQRRDDELPF